MLPVALFQEFQRTLRELPTETLEVIVPERFKKVEPTDTDNRLRWVGSEVEHRAFPWIGQHVDLYC